MNNKLKQLAQNYINDVNTACFIMLKGLNLNTKEDLIKYRQMQSSGSFFLNGDNKYTFHGRGCRFKNNELEIDWDFGYDDT